MREKHTRQPWWLRRKPVLIALPVLLILGLALGLGLGLTIGRDDDDGDSEEEAPAPSPTQRTRWKPAVNDTWQIVLLNPIELEPDATSVTPDVAVFDIDLFDTPKETIDTLHRLGKKVICYFSGGSFEPGRPDSEEFDSEDLGAELDGWPGERWLKLGSDGVREIMRKRVELAHEKGCDGIDPDNVDGYQNENGLGVTEEDSISFLSYLSDLAVPRNLSLGLKNAGDIIERVLTIVDFSVNEQCVEHAECETFKSFIDVGKPVFHIEYPDGAGSKLRTNTVGHFCGRMGDAYGSNSFSTVLKKMNLDGWVEYCNERVEVTDTM